MAFHNVNYEVVTLTGTMTEGQLGNNVTGSCVHEIFCTTTGNITITPFKGSSFSWSATAGQNIKLLVKEVTVNSGAFIGFKAKWYQSPNVVFQPPA